MRSWVKGERGVELVGRTLKTWRDNKQCVLEEYLLLLSHAIVGVSCCEDWSSLRSHRPLDTVITEGPTRVDISRLYKTMENTYKSSVLSTSQDAQRF